MFERIRKTLRILTAPAFADLNNVLENTWYNPDLPCSVQKIEAHPSLYDDSRQRQSIISFKPSHSTDFLVNSSILRLSDNTKAHVLFYLANNEFRALSVIGKHIRNIFTQEEINAYGTVLDDGEYTWSDDLWIYVQNYDLELPQRFVDKVERFFVDKSLADIALINSAKESASLLSLIEK